MLYYNKMSDVDNEIEEKIINKLKKTITIKKVLSEKQQNHINKLGQKKKGTKYTKIVEPKDVKDIPVEIITKKVKKKKIVIPIESNTESQTESQTESEESIVVVKPKKKHKKKIVVESSSEEEVIVVKKKPKKIIKKEIKHAINERLYNDIF